MTTLPLAMLGWQEILPILLVLLLLFGGAKLPQLARSMGSSINEFKKGLKESEEDGPVEIKAGAKTEGNGDE